MTAQGALSRSCKAKWEGLRLRVDVASGADLRVDLRLGSEISGPSLIKGGRVLDERGRTSFLVSDEHDRETACLVVWTMKVACWPTVR